MDDLISKDPQQNKRNRFELLNKAQDNEKVQEQIVEYCSRGEAGMLFWINNFAWIYEPRIEHKTIPFITYDYQDGVLKEMLWCIENEEDYFLDKSRDMGATWMALAVFEYGNIFRDWSFLIGSRREDEVEKFGDMDKLVPKLRFMFNRLTEWMKPRMIDAYMRFAKVDTEASIIGESTNVNFGTGGRYKAALLDEFSKWAETSWSAWTSLAEATPCRMVLSTPLGSGTKQAELRDTPIKQRHLHWTLHPLKNKDLYKITEEEKKQRKLRGGLTRSPWYDKKCLRMKDDEIAQELDINYERSAGGRVYGAEWDELKASGRFVHVPYQPGLDTFTFWDFGIGDATAVGIAQVAPGGAEVYIIDHIEENNKKISYFADWVNNHEWDGDKIEYAGHYGDIAGRNRNQITGTSIFEDLMENHDITITARETTEIDEKHAVQKILPKTMVDQKLTKFDKSFQNFHYEWDQLKGEYHRKPHHDRFSHTPKAFAYFCVNHFVRVDEDDDDDELEVIKTEPQESSLTKKIRELREQAGGADEDQYLAQ